MRAMAQGLLYARWWRSLLYAVGSGTFVCDGSGDYCMRGGGGGYFMRGGAGATVCAAGAGVTYFRRGASGRNCMWVRVGVTIHAAGVVTAHEVASICARATVCGGAVATVCVASA